MNDEMEIRIYAYDWDSSKFQAWILQILFSELLDIPVSIESGNANIDFSFYSPEEVGQSGGVNYNEFSSLSRGLRHAYIYGDCRFAEKKVLARYETCAHFSPEVRFPIIEVEDYLVNDYSVRVAEPLEPTGAIGEQGLYIPKFTAERDPTLASYLGMAGEKNRRKLADAFPRPIRWREYCSRFSPSKCTAADSVASRAPVDAVEGNRFFVPGLFNGHFRKTEKNDCDKNPLTCTGHVADYPCNLFSPVENQIFHLGLALEGDGLLSRFGYLLSELPEIWHAANATKSNVLLYWTQPTVLSNQYFGTDAEFSRVAFPLPSQDCLDARKVEVAEKCLTFKDESFGNPDSLCDSPPFQLQKATTSSLYDVLVDGVPEAIQSPAYAVLQAYSLPQTELLKLFEGLGGYDDPRRAVCEWVSDNMETLERFIPSTYPRVIQDKDQNAIQYVTLVLGGFSVCLVVWTARKVFANRKKRAICFAQVEFLAIMLLGSLLTALGAVIGGLSRNDAVCSAEIWLVYLGYSLFLVPQVVKIAAINQLRSGSRLLQRFRISLKNLYSGVALVSLLVMVYLTVWTVLDAPRSRVHYTLTDTKTLEGETIVLTSYSCGSETMVREYVAFAWNGLLLIAALVLTVQTRNVIRSFNESKTLGLLIYTNFVFFMLRGLTYYLEGLLDRSEVIAYRSMIYALDVTAGLFVYFWTKILLLDDESTRRRQPTISGGSFDSFSCRTSFSPTAINTSGRFIPQMTNISDITLHQNDDLHSVGLKQRDDENGLAPLEESPRIDGDATAVTFSVTTTSNNGGATRIQELEAVLVSLKAEAECLRKQIEDSEPPTLVTVGADPPSPRTSDEPDEHAPRDSPKVQLLSTAIRIPSPMPSSSSDQETQSSSIPPNNSQSSESTRESQFSQSDNESLVTITAANRGSGEMTSAAPSVIESQRERDMSLVEENQDVVPRMPTRRPSAASEPSDPNPHERSSENAWLGPLRRSPGQTPLVLESVSIELVSVEEEETDC